jgi:V8-like Glu-specific endopeptidase
VARQSTGDEELLRRRAAEKESARALAGAAGAEGHRSVSNPAAARGGAAGGRGGESAPAPTKGETETPFHGWPAARAEAALDATAGRLLDAWHGTYSSATIRALLRRDRSVAESALEVIVDQDDREQVTDTSEFPWRCICSLAITAANGERFIGTGWLAGPNTVLTAGHCVYMHDAGGWVQQIGVYPARNGDDTPYSYVSNVFRSVTAWIQNQDSGYDYGAILLPEATPVGFFGYSSLTDAELSGLLVSLYGYPSDKPQGTLWGHYRQLTQVLPRNLRYNIATVGGQSGAPVWDKNGDQRSVVGIHTTGDVSGNRATRITDEVFDNIETWKAGGGS